MGRSGCCSGNFEDLIFYSLVFFLKQAVFLTLFLMHATLTIITYYYVQL